MRFEILTLFPDYFRSPLEISLIGRAISRKLLQVQVHNLRDWASGKRRAVDDVPYGGGPGMVLRPEPVVEALESLQERLGPRKVRRIFFSPQGIPLRQGQLKDYLQYDALLLLCGRYEGVDQRALDLVIDEEVSLGDYLLNGGEAAALVFIEAVSRLIPGVIGKEESLESESFSGIEQPLLEYPQYTRPEEFRGRKVPSILLSGNHQAIETWRKEKALERTRRRRPDLLKT